MSKDRQKIEVTLRDGQRNDITNKMYPRLLEALDSIGLDVKWTVTGGGESISRPISVSNEQIQQAIEGVMGWGITAEVEDVEPT